VKPAGYPIPVDGPVGELLRAQCRHNMRPAHLHVLATKEGFKTLISQVYVPDDPNLDSDVQFGVTKHLIGDFVRHDNGAAPVPGVEPPWYSLAHTFTMEPGRSRLPRPPITDKARASAHGSSGWWLHRDVCGPVSELPSIGDANTPQY
jgi:catechol 1,2-dioxygenase